MYLTYEDLLVEGLRHVPLLKCKVPEAGMFMLVDVRETGLSSTDFAWQLFRETGVAVLDASAFGATIPIRGDTVNGAAQDFLLPPRTVLEA